MRRSLEAAGPLEFLSLASTMLDIADPGPLETAAGADSLLDELLDSIIGTRRRETTALLWAWAAMLPDGEDAARVRAALASRSDPMPRWLRRLGDAEIGRAYRVTDIYGDQEHLAFEFSIERTQMAFAVLIDHNAGSAVADGFPVRASIDELLASAHEEPGLDAVQGDPGVVGADLAFAIDVGRHTIPEFETETWPGVRPMLEWLVRRFPHGESGFAATEELHDEERDRIVTAFLSSPFAAGLDSAERREAVRLIVDFAAGYGRVSPFGWSTTRLDIFANDWYPRKVYADDEFHEAVGEALPRFLEFAHDRLGVPADESSRVVQLARALAPSLGLTSASASPDIADSMTQWLARRVGGQAELDALDATPVPDEAMSWEGIDDEIRPQVSEVLGLLDELARELEDREYRTLFRRALARTARGDPAVFTRRGSRPGLTAAIAWVVGRGNDLFDWITVGDMNEFFGLKRGYSTADRGHTVAKAMGLDRWEFDHADLIGADLLRSAVREHILDLADAFGNSLGEDIDPI